MGNSKTADEPTIKAPNKSRAMVGRINNIHPIFQPKQLKKDPKYRVIPNLSMRGKDVMMRLKNRSLMIDHNGQYSLDPEIDATRKMTRLDTMLAAKNNYNKINGLSKKLSNLNKPNTNV